MQIFIVKVCYPNLKYYFFKNLEDAQLFHFKKFYESTKTTGMYVVKEIEEVFLAESVDDSEKFGEKLSRYHAAGA